MDPAEFASKEEKWLKWKKATEDYVDEVHPDMKQALSFAAQTKSPVTDRFQVNPTEGGRGPRGQSLRIAEKKDGG